VVQPVSSMGLVFMMLFSHFVLEVRQGGRAKTWAGGVLMPASLSTSLSPAAESAPLSPGGTVRSLASVLWGWPCSNSSPACLPFVQRAPHSRAGSGKAEIHPHQDVSSMCWPMSP
jgi:hypothetical protein